jgi:hypothetical protein
MLRLRRGTTAPPPIVAPPVHTRVTLLVDGARYGGRVDDIVDGALVIAAPDASLSLERPVLVEWNDGAGVWQMPGEVAAARQYPFPTTSVKPTGASECVATPPAETPGISVAAKVVSSSRLPVGTRVPVTTLNLRGNRLALWTILPLERGDVVDIVANTGGDRLVKARVRVSHSAPQSGSWLARVACRPDESDPSSAALVGAVRARVARPALAPA